MNIALAGYGKMGHEVEAVALERGHKITLIIDIDNIDRLNPGALAGVDVVIEFTVPGAAPEIIGMLLKSSIPVVSGTTGWLSRYDEVSAMALHHQTSFIHSSNYSPGVYMVSRLNAMLASYMMLISGYDVGIEEIHHTAKIDSPSGTAIMLSEQIVSNNDRFNGWTNTGEENSSLIPIKSLREGLVPGTHHIKWTSDKDSITLSHEAFGRKGFALGAVMSAEFIVGKKGVFRIEDIFGF